MEKKRMSCQEEILFSTLDGSVCRCRCGGYHVRVNAVTLHLTPSQFDAAARLFKMAMGIVAGRGQATSGVKEGVC